MIKPDATKYNPDPDYLRELIEKIGLSQTQCARVIGRNERTFRDYLNKNHASKHDYTTQYALEMLALYIEQDKH